MRPGLSVVLTEWFNFSTNLIKWKTQSKHILQLPVDESFLHVKTGQANLYWIGYTHIN